MRLILASASPRRAELLRAAGIEFDVMHADVDESVRAGETPARHVTRLAEAKARTVLRRAGRRPVLSADTVVVVDGAILGKPGDDADARRMLRMLSGRSHEVVTGVCLMRGATDGAGGRGKGEGGRGRWEGGRALGMGIRGQGLGDGRPGIGDKNWGPGERERFSGDEQGEGGRGKWEAPEGVGPKTMTETVTTTVEFASLTNVEVDWYVASGEPADKAGGYAIQGRAARFVTRIDGSYSNVVGLPVAVVYQLCRRAGLLIS